mmetsp:Transcript_16882/g.57807  ORF Transcript_16882/g.57807 Transcript_16882/m.57807 type:complete len:391 (-) Transcript_16882:860-2032(-)
MAALFVPGEDAPERASRQVVHRNRPPGRRRDHGDAARGRAQHLVACQVRHVQRDEAEWRLGQHAAHQGARLDVELELRLLHVVSAVQNLDVDGALRRNGLYNLRVHLHRPLREADLELLDFEDLLAAVHQRRSHFVLVRFLGLYQLLRDACEQIDNFLRLLLLVDPLFGELGDAFLRRRALGAQPQRPGALAREADHGALVGRRVEHLCLHLLEPHVGPPHLQAQRVGDLVGGVGVAPRRAVVGELALGAVGEGTQHGRLLPNVRQGPKQLLRALERDVRFRVAARLEERLAEAEERVALLRLARGVCFLCIAVELFDAKLGIVDHVARNVPGQPRECLLELLRKAQGAVVRHDALGVMQRRRLRGARARVETRELDDVDGAGFERRFAL